MRHALAAALALGALSAPARSGPAAPTDDPTKIIAHDGALVVTDGSSYFRFEKGGTFRAGPLGMSGQTIEGTWTCNGGYTFTIVGTWGWINGVSARNDRRRMVVGIEPPCDLDKTTSSVDPDAKPLRRCYWVVEELVKLPKKK